jgi:peptide-methionine (S)-S-oxide reductase
MKIMKLNSLFILLLLISSCIYSTSPSNKTEAIEKIAVQDLNSYEKAYFASGCFWCVEAIFESVEGVKEAVSGYAGGDTKNPTYRSIGTGLTGHAEAVVVYYDPKIVSYATLVRVFFGSHDPTTANRQGPDRGSQYRSIAFYQNDAEREIIQNYINTLNKANIYSNEIVTEVSKLEKFYEAEAYHQDYERLNPDNPYIKNVSIPRLKRFQKLYPELLKKGKH